jgi:hypothetical protein
MKHIYTLSLVLLLSITLLSGCSEKPGADAQQVDRLPVISPDYSFITFPPNIAPLNFSINEKGNAFYVEIEGVAGKKLNVSSRKNIIQIPEKKWHELIAASAGNEINIKIWVKGEDGKWSAFQPIVNHVATDKIDPYLAYRLINAGYEMWYELGIYQRNLENFDESPILENKGMNNACMNCHSFCQNDPKKMSLHLRKNFGGTLILSNGKLRKVNSKTASTMSAGVYPSWHPSGKFIAYSVNIVEQRFASVKTNKIDVSDKASDIVLYNLDKDEITTAPQISTPNRENLPSWSPDGKWMYYISAPKSTDAYHETYDKYSLVRVSFDENTCTWGQPDTVLSASKCGFSISFPKISPDGHFLVFTASNYGYFSIHHTEADLYILDLQTLQYKKLNINSDQAESYHCWSSNGRWMVFSSRALDGLYARPFFCYVDNDGNMGKPFVMPQKDPMFYNTFLKNYNIPELIMGKVDVSPNEMRDAGRQDAKALKLDPSVDVDGLSGATWVESQKGKK